MCECGNNKNIKYILQNGNQFRTYCGSHRCSIALDMLFDPNWRFVGNIPLRCEAVNIINDSEASESGRKGAETRSERYGTCAVSLSFGALLDAAEELKQGRCP